MNLPRGEHPSARSVRKARRRPWRRALMWGFVWAVGCTGGDGRLFGVATSGIPRSQVRLPYARDCEPLRGAAGTNAAAGARVVAAEQGFRPGSLVHVAGERQASSRGPLFYNLARGGSSPLMYLLTLRRLLADGVHPDGLLVEIFPPALAEEESGVTIHKPTLRDVPLLRRYAVHGRSWAFWLQDRLLLWYKYRSGFLAWAAPQMLPPTARWGDHLWDYQGGEWRVIGTGVSPGQRRRLTDDAHRRYASALRHFSIDPDADRALRELLDICRAHRIDVLLFLMPESREFRRWYPAETRRLLGGLPGHVATRLRRAADRCPRLDRRR